MNNSTKELVFQIRSSLDMRLAAHEFLKIKTGEYVKCKSKDIFCVLFFIETVKSAEGHSIIRINPSFGLGSILLNKQLATRTGKKRSKYLPCIVRDFGQILPKDRPSQWVFASNDQYSPQAASLLSDLRAFRTGAEYEAGFNDIQACIRDFVEPYFFKIQTYRDLMSEIDRYGHQFYRDFAIPVLLEATRGMTTEPTQGLTTKDRDEKDEEPPPKKPPPPSK